MRRFYEVSLLLFFAFSASAQRIKIPVDTTRWYQLNQTAGTLAKLFDGNKDTRAFTGWGKILYKYDAYYPLLPGETMTVDSVRIYDKEGIFTTTPLILYGITDTWERKIIADFTGELYNAWVGPYSSRRTVFKLDSPITNIRYLQLNIVDNNFPGEIELYGTYTPPTATTPVFNASTGVPLKNMLGINGFPWSLAPPSCTWCVDSLKLKAIAGFRAFRHYLDWGKMEEKEGQYTFSPLMGGGWHLDTTYKSLQQQGVEILATIQNIPPWMAITYPDSIRSISNNPVRYGDPYDAPASYLQQAKLGFQYAARYGRNPNIDSSLVSVYSVPLWPKAKVNQKKIGLGYIKYIECGNEQNKWWGGRQGYLSGREYAANLSAFYDGHKNTMGAGVGVKNADSTMVVVMMGLAAISPDYVKGMVDWCKEFRGYKADGSVNLCFDVINYHLYSVDAASQSSGATARGSAAELSNSISVARDFVRYAREQLNGMPVWITEQGYDINQGSPYNAIPIGNKTALQTQADWILRSALLYAREGLKMGFFYESYDVDTASGYKFASMGLLNKSDYSRKPAADFLYQTAKLFGEYVYQETLLNDPYVDRYALNGQDMYALAVPDDKGRTATYTLNLGGADSAVVYTPMAGESDMAKQTVAAVNGQVTLTVTETPSFVVPLNVAATPSTAASLMMPEVLNDVERTKPASALLFPNPTSGDLFVQNKKGGNCRLLLLSMQGKTVYEAQVSGTEYVLSLHRLPAGVYPLYLLTETGAQIFSQLVVKR